MGNLTRWVPRLITGTAIVHLAYGLAAPSMARSLRGIAGDGFANTVGGDPERASWLWYMLTGVATLGLGEVARWGVRETGRVPARLGGWLLAVAVPLTVAMPASGGWLVAAVGAIALRAARDGGTAARGLGRPPRQQRRGGLPEVAGDEGLAPRAADGATPAGY